MGNGEEQADLAIRSLKAELITLDTSPINLKIEICHNLFTEINKPYFVGLVSVYPKESDQLIARFIMDPWAGYCTAIDEIEQCYPRLTLKPAYRI